MTTRTNRPDVTQSATIRAELDALVGRTIPGGCQDCQADQLVTDEGNGVYRLTILHEGRCPMLRRAQR